MTPGSNYSQLNRREVLRIAGASAAVGVVSSVGGLPGVAGATTTTVDASGRTGTAFWPNGARLAVSISLMFEGGGQPISGAGGVIPDCPPLNNGGDRTGWLGRKDSNLRISIYSRV